MNPGDFHASETGTLVQDPQGFWAFAPAPLPPNLTYGPELVRLLSRADAALSELSGLGRRWGRLFVASDVLAAIDGRAE
jgi:hypothetical protein